MVWRSPRGVNGASRIIAFRALDTAPRAYKFDVPAGFGGANSLPASRKLIRPIRSSLSTEAPLDVILGVTAAYLMKRSEHRILTTHVEALSGQRNCAILLQRGKSRPT